MLHPVDNLIYVVEKWFSYCCRATARDNDSLMMAFFLILPGAGVKCINARTQRRIQALSGKIYGKVKNA